MTAATQEADPSVFVIFGGTGDLARRKILPALYQLHVQGATRRGCTIIGVTRDVDMDDVRYRAMVVDAVVASGEDKQTVTAWAVGHVYFQSVPDTSRASYDALKARIEGLERGASANRAFYVALPPQAFEPTIRGLGDAGLHRSAGWTRIVIEKPFGRDLQSARALNDLLHTYFEESQVYRIDHYLGKETVQNLLVFRFANAMFESLWNRDHIECVKITVAEEVGVEQRAGYYDGAGALRDMVQSHLTQLLALVAMEVPSAIMADAIRMEKIKALRAIVPLQATNAVVAQYGPGVTAGRKVPAYRDEPGVAPGSRTETFAAVRLDIDNWRWQGVPFFLRTGKRLARRLTEIEVRFRRAPVWMFRGVKADGLRSNTLLLTLQPDEGFSLFVDVKVPGEPFRLHRLPLHFNYAEAFKSLPDAYQTLLLDLLLGDSTLFVHADEVEVAWSLYEPLLGGTGSLYSYPAGSDGPPEANSLAGMPVAL